MYFLAGHRNYSFVLTKASAVDKCNKAGDVYGKMLVLTFEDNEDAMMNRILSLINTKEEVIPTIHLGERASALERKGIRTERGNINRAIEKYNAMIMKIYGFISELKEELKKGVFKFVFERKSRTEKDGIQSINQSIHQCFRTKTKARGSDCIGDVAETKVRNGCKTDFHICTEI